MTKFNKLNEINCTSFGEPYVELNYSMYMCSKEDELLIQQIKLNRDLKITK